jgi:hypothetical protein
MARLTVQRILGAIWLLDGLLQFRPKMFTEGFLTVNVKPLMAGQPIWFSHLLAWEVQVMSHPEWAFNLMIAIIQTLLGLLLLTNRYPRAALLGSIAWATAVWVFGEGLGGLLFGSWSLIAGAPGAAALYALMAVVVWPPVERSRTWNRVAAPISLGIVAVGGILTMVAVAQNAQVAVGLSGHASAVLLACEALIMAGVGLLASWRLRWLGATILAVLAAVAWIFLQHVGGIWMAYSTDINSGGLWVLVAVSVALMSREDALRRLSHRRAPVASRMPFALDRIHSHRAG